jgi:hypothetical protein
MIRQLGSSTHTGADRDYGGDRLLRRWRERWRRAPRAWIARYVPPESDSVLGHTRLQCATISYGLSQVFDVTDYPVPFQTSKEICSERTASRSALRTRAGGMSSRLECRRWWCTSRPLDDREHHHRPPPHPASPIKHFAALTVDIAAVIEHSKLGRLAGEVGSQLVRYPVVDGRPGR